MTKFGDMTRDEKLALFTAWIDGQTIECTPHESALWSVIVHPNWLEDVHYRVSITPDTVDWSHVAPQFKFMARDQNDRVFLYEKRPDLETVGWYERLGDIAMAGAFASYKQGTVDWKDSLVERPKE